jgi:hypothetical protein
MGTRAGMNAVESRTISCLCWEPKPGSSVVQPPSLAAVPTYEYLLGEHKYQKEGPCHSSGYLPVDLTRSVLAFIQTSLVLNSV